MMNGSPENTQNVDSSLVEFLSTSEEWTLQETEESTLVFKRVLVNGYSAEIFSFNIDENNKLSGFDWEFKAGNNFLKTCFVRNESKNDLKLTDVYFNEIHLIPVNGFSIGFPFGSSVCRCALVIDGQYDEEKLSSILRSRDKGSPTFANPSSRLEANFGRDENGIHY
jgi:hypothetical protein